jgi:hypothetical protein
VGAQGDYTCGECENMSIWDESDDSDVAEYWNKVSKKHEEAWN